MWIKFLNPYHASSVDITDYTNKICVCIYNLELLMVNIKKALTLDNAGLGFRLDKIYSIVLFLHAHS